MADWVDRLIDVIGLGFDISTKRAVNQMTMGGRPLAGGAAKAAGFLSRVASELGWGWEDEAGFTIEISKLKEPDEVAEINRLVKILDKRQLNRLKLIVHNAPGTPEKTKVTPEKKGKDGSVTAPEKVEILSPKQSGGVLFLSALAKLLKDERSDADKIALMQKLGHLPSTKSFIEAAESKVKTMLRKELGLDSEQEYTFGQLIDAATAKIKAIKVEPIEPQSVGWIGYLIGLAIGTKNIKP